MTWTPLVYDYENGLWFVPCKHNPWPQYSSSSSSEQKYRKRDKLVIYLQEEEVHGESIH